jgi:hypothetical protein
MSLHNNITLQQDDDNTNVPEDDASFKAKVTALFQLPNAYVLNQPAQGDGKPRERIQYQWYATKKIKMNGTRYRY